MRSSSKIWGMQPGENKLEFPCDIYQDTFSDTYYRGITIHATPQIVYRWLCQMKIAPYSYDWIDNLGRTSPQKLIPGVDQLEIGQKVMVIFNLIGFEKNTHLTLQLNRQFPNFLGDTVISYRIFPKKNGTCRLLVKIFVNYPKGLSNVIFQHIFAVGDLVMMRRQLMNFKSLSECTQMFQNL